LRQDIDNYLDGFTVSAASPTIFDRFFKLIRRRPLIPAVLLAIGLSWASYYGVNQLLQIAAEDTLRKIIVDNTKTGNANRRLALLRSRRLQKAGLSEAERSAIYQNMFVSAANAAVEYNLVFDAASRLSPDAQENFLRSGGSKIFSQLLRMLWRVNDKELLRETLKRCNKQWKELFDHARKIDAELDALVNRIAQQLKM
jgi:hypothetical protein